MILAKSISVNMISEMFLAKNALDKSRLRKVSCESSQKITIFQARASMWMTVFQAAIFKDLHFRR